MSHPLTGIVVLVHNQLENVTKDFIKHLYANTEDFVVLFFDNASVDGSAEYLKNLCSENDNARYFYSDRNIGVASGREAGKNIFFSEFPNTEYLLTIDNDQYVAAGWLDQLYSIVDKNYQIVGIDAWRLCAPGTGGMVNIRGQMINDRSYFPFKHCQKKEDLFTYVGGGGCLVHQSVYGKVSFSLKSNIYFEDSDFIFQSAQAGYKYMWCCNCNVLHLGHQTINAQTTYDKSAEFMKSWNAFKKKWNPYFPPLLEGMKAS